MLLDAERGLPDDLFDQVRRVFPRSDPDRLERRWAMSIMTFIHALSRADEWSRDRRGLTPAELELFYEDLVRFVGGGVCTLLDS